jgi:hypothetical protein
LSILIFLLFCHYDSRMYKLSWYGIKKKIVILN